ncbi:MAG: CRISPR-associated endonuclease Cas3'' [Anaerococcus sp.]|nr:CRISPR-associated endonuclease Cas3'' [Anaerococcus sp.]
MNFDKAYAHIDQKDRSKRQVLMDHLIATGLSAGKQAQDLGLDKIGLLTGLLHDLGKFKDDFQEKIINSTNKRVDHSTLGAIFIKSLAETYLDDYYSNFDEEKYFVFGDYVHVLIYAIESHHGQFDFISMNKDKYFTFPSFERINKNLNKGYGDNFFKDLSSFFKNKGFDLYDIFSKGFDQYQAISKKIKDLARRSSKEPHILEAEKFYQSLLIRLIISILKSADIKDTINSYEKIIKDSSELSSKDLDYFEDQIDSKYQSFGIPTSPINKARKEISDAILKRSRKDGPGIYRLNLPTGSGKTLLSLLYGIKQMKYKERKRFFYVTSYLSVLEQNAKEIRDVIKKDQAILEHHSNVVDDQESKDMKTLDDFDDSLDSIRKDFLKNDWTSPIILTTMVQFFNSIFKEKSANITRFKSMTKSVIILDELQSLPTDILYMTNLSLNFLSEIMKATIVLSTASQPLYSSSYLNHKLIYGADNSNKDLFVLSKDQSRVFRRVSHRLLANGRQLSLDDLSDLLEKESSKSRLAILNTKASVKELYEIMRARKSYDKLYYLTTNLHAKDRLTKIGEIKKDLKDKKNILVVSTPLN